MLSIKVENMIPATCERMRKQVRFAARGAIDDTAFAVQADLRAHMTAVFDRPTPFTLQSVRVTTVGQQMRMDAASTSAGAPPGARLMASVQLVSPGGKAVDPNNILEAHIEGGRRRVKRAESALQRLGVLPRGFAMVPGAAAPRDMYGNVPGPFIVRLLSYLQAFGEQGYRANMTARNKAKLSGRGRWVDGRFAGAHTKAGSGRAGAAAYRQGGVEYFVSRGKGEWPARTPTGKVTSREQHLPAGIWERTGLYGAIVKPVFLFVRLPSYGKRLRWYETAGDTVRRAFPVAMSLRLRQALETAR